MQESIFSSAPRLPRGPHGLSRAEVSTSQRTRLMAALAELLADRGYAAVTIGELAARAGVSRGTFYEHFADKEACLLAAYDHFAASLREAMAAEVAEDAPWNAFIDAALSGYLGTLERDPVSARAFVVQMDAAGSAALERRRVAVHAFAALLAQRHAAIREREPTLGPVPDRVYLGLALGVRGLVQEALQSERAPALTELAPDIVVWITATVEGAAQAQRRRER
jgi:AcrR family transcriptional regulator